MISDGDASARPLVAAGINAPSNNSSVVSASFSSAWFDELRQNVLSCFTSTRTEMECGLGSESDITSFHLPHTLSCAITILTSDADHQRRNFVEYISATNGIQFLLQMLDITATYKIGEQTAKVLRELVSPKSGKQRIVIIKQCLDTNYLALTVSVLKQLVKGSSSSGSPAPTSSSLEYLALSSVLLGGTGSTTSDYTAATAISGFTDLGNGGATTVDFIWFLAGVVAKDSKFSTKVRRMLKVKFFHDAFKKLFFARSNLHFPLLRIIKQLSKDRFAIEVLGKDKVMGTVKKCLAVLNIQPNTKLLMLLEWITFLTRERKNCIRFLKAGLLVKVLNCFKNWAQWRGKGLLKMSKYVINIYAHLARTKSGRKSLVTTEAIQMIRTFCAGCPTDRSFDDVITRACGMIYICYGKEALPLEKLECPIKFEIPHSAADGVPTQSPLLLIDSGSSSDEDDPEADADDEGDDSDNSDDNDSLNNQSDSENDELCDNDDEVQETAELEPSTPVQNSRKNSFDVSSQEKSKTSDVDRISAFARFFQEFSPDYNAVNEAPDILGLTPEEKLEFGMADCILEESEDSSTLTLDVNESKLINGNVSSTSSGHIPLAAATSSIIPASVHKYSWTSRHGAKLPRSENLRKLYLTMANKVKHVSPFVKIAYPDICFGLSGKQIESLCANADRTVIRKRLQAFIARAVSEHPGFRQKVVFSLDELIMKEKRAPESIGNNDEADVGKYDPKAPLSFESRFECGNLRKAIHMAEHEYDLFLTSDINSSRHNQWFYFQVSNVSEDTPYIFNIVNCIKTNSLFNYGMQPVIFSVTDAMRHRPGWVRSGSSICYFRNGYKCIGKKSIKNYQTLSFTINFQHRGDVVYIAYHIPFTYTRLMVELYNLLGTTQHSEKVHYRYDQLCKGLDGNIIPLVTITGPIILTEGQNLSRIVDREVVFITSRVHPGETNASWVMMGILRKLLSGNNVEDLLQRYVFKIVPMLNAEGVINGCHRSGLTSQDLNRCWRTPHEVLHASIYHTKMLVAYCCKILGREPTVFLDLHGHSRRKNAFFYGCSFARSWRQEDRVTPENPQKLYALAESMSVHCPYFVMHFCHYDVRKSRETTARVAMWREYGITCSFTLECSYCGCDRGPCKGVTFGSGQLWEIGEGLCDAIGSMECKLQAAVADQKQAELEEVSMPVIEEFIG